MDKADNSKASILIVDDTPANLRLLAQMLTPFGYRLRIAEDGPRALESVRANRPDLMLLDVMMPGMNGYEVCGQLRSDPVTRDIPIIFISALDATQDKVHAFTAGGVDYITKPFHAEEVVARVETHLARRELQKQLQVANQELARANDELEQRVAARTAELVMLNAAYERFVPGEFLAYLAKSSVVDVQLGDQVQHDMTIMFTDIHDFTPRVERLTPQASFNFLNAYLGQVSPIIRQYKGIIDKYMGDGIMALFPQSADDALTASIAIQRALANYNQCLETNGETPISTGVGLHFGSVTLGIIGESQRLQGTVISDAVNLASRLEELCKSYGTAIMVSQETLNAAHLEYHSRFMDQVQVRGKKGQVAVFELFDGDANAMIELKLKTKGDFEEGLELYQAGEFAQACVRFDRVLTQNPNDQAARLYLRRCAQSML